MNEDDLISVVMPAYNAEKFIAESIESVLAQTYNNWELLIVDDGSTDNTKTIIKGFCIKDQRIKYYYQENGRQGKARNLALKHAHGKYIAFLDADDLWLPEKLHLQLEDIKREQADLVFADAKIFCDKLSDSIAVMQAGKGIFEGDIALKNFLEQNKIPILTVLMKVEVLREMNGFTELPAIQNAEDYHLWLRLLMNKKKLFGSSAVLAGYREHVSASTISDKLSIAKVIEAFEDLKRNYKPYKKLITSFQKKWFKKYHYSTSQWTGNTYKSLIKKNCSYISKTILNPFFQLMYSVFGLRATRKLITKILNQSIML